MKSRTLPECGNQDLTYIWKLGTPPEYGIKKLSTPSDRENHWVRCCSMRIKHSMQGMNFKKILFSWVLIPWWRNEVSLYRLILPPFLAKQAKRAGQSHLHSKKWAYNQLSVLPSSLQLRSWCPNPGISPPPPTKYNLHVESIFLKRDSAHYSFYPSK